MMPQTYFLYLDETYNEEVSPSVAALTGILLTTQKSVRIRNRIYDTVISKAAIEPNTIIAPPELHFSNFLRDYPDEVKYYVMNKLVDIVLEEEVAVYRVGYYLTEELLRIFSTNSISVCWFGIMSVIQPALEHNTVVPVLDVGFDPGFQPIASIFSMPVKEMDMMRSYGLGESVSISNSHNLLDVLYADSRFSTLIQLVDVIAGLRRLSETVRETGKEFESEYNQQLYNISKRLDPAMIYEDVIRMKFAH
jgi:hypothetical protein